MYPSEWSAFLHFSADIELAATTFSYGVCFASSLSSFLNPDKFCSSSSPLSSTTLSESSSSEQSDLQIWLIFTICAIVVNTTSLIATAVMVILSVWWQFHLLLVGFGVYWRRTRRYRGRNGVTSQLDSMRMHMSSSSFLRFLCHCG